MENKNEEENQLVINDINSLNSGKNTTKSSFSWKKIFVISAILFFIIILIIILIIFLSKKSKSSDKEEERLDIGRIICTYEMINDVKILGDDFMKISDFDIYINGTKMKYSKTYDLAFYGVDSIEIRLYSDLNMDNMFKGLTSLISVEMISFNNTKIISMISTFEDCKNFEFFSISGFSGNELKSMKKLFYKTNLHNFIIYVCKYSY